MTNKERFIELCKEMERLRTMYVNAIDQFQKIMKPGNDDYKMVQQHSNEFNRCSKELNSLWTAL